MAASFTTLKGWQEKSRRLLILIIPDCRPWSLFANELTLFFAFIVFISSLNLVKKEGACFQKFMKILENKRLFGRIHY
jgi:hypothetical protein